MAEQEVVEIQMPVEVDGFEYHGSIGDEILHYWDNTEESHAVRVRDKGDQFHTEVGDYSEEVGFLEFPDVFLNVYDYEVEAVCAALQYMNDFDGDFDADEFPQYPDAVYDFLRLPSEETEGLKDAMREGVRKELDEQIEEMVEKIEDPDYPY